jgi:SAM-dependent methyltransferase
MEQRNVYADSRRAASYAALEFPGTYFLAYRDLPAIIRKHVRGHRAVDFGCGAGRSTRFLRSLGFAAVGVDIAEPMLQKARELDPAGDYRLLGEGELALPGRRAWDLVLSVFTFDNIPTLERKVRLLRELKSLLRDGGRIVALDSTPEIYRHEWASFSTRDFPENRQAQSGDTVRIIMTDVDDKRPVEDILWTDEDYQETFRQAGLQAIEKHLPLGRQDEPQAWVSETSLAPWVIYVLG